MKLHSLIVIAVVLASPLPIATAEDEKNQKPVASVDHDRQQPSLADALLFHASFDESADADFAKGDARIQTAKSLKRENVQAGLHSDAVKLDRKQGRYGGSLSFTKKSEQIVFFKGAGNLPPAKADFRGSYSFWLRLTPEQDLPPGYVDPLQITDKKWNDASFFVDFTKETPRKFRLGVFADYKFWNPQDRKWDDIPDDERPLVTVQKPPFSREKWTHIGITFREFNGKNQDGVATLYLNGESVGQLKRKQRFTWSEERLAIMIGIYYVGQFDDFAIFNRDLTASEIQQVFELPKGIASLR
jgi:hypothetical protein